MSEPSVNNFEEDFVDVTIVWPSWKFGSGQSEAFDTLRREICQLSAQHTGNLHGDRAACLTSDYYKGDAFAIDGNKRPSRAAHAVLKNRR